jgi:O-antigen/teichoic acid export membrane protein
MIKALLPDGDFEAGVYAAGYRVLDALNMIAFLFAVMLFPMFSKGLKDIAVLHKLIDEGVRYMGFLVIPVCLFAVLNSDRIMNLLYVQADAYWGLVFQRLIVTFFATGIMYVFGTLLTAAGELRSLNYVYALTVALNIGLNFLLIPQYKAGGAALSTLATQLFAATCILFLSYKKVPQSLAGSVLIRLLGFAIVCFLVNWLTIKWWPEALWLWSVPLIGILTLGLARAFRVVGWAEIRGLVQEE